MASEVEIVNIAMTLLGETRIISLDDDTKPAREAKAIFAADRDALLAGYNWSFAMARQQLSVLATPPVFRYLNQYLLPADCLRVVQVGTFFHGVDLTDYRGCSTEEFQIEGRNILTDLGAPLDFRYVKRVIDATLFSANFVKAFGAQLAADLAEPLTQSDTKRARALDQFQTEINLAIRANAIELPPKKLADDEWIMSRL